ncbi:MAG: DEAD/DEAH box helicase family protein [Ignavibacteria bacterium]|jgi:superfamily II DNA or RNA helicase|nr:DEAD/DEAH box helicase family protein [Ignavibacteria bacterium]MDH7527294.1 DEAD/DEAH box helicase family protein [Ignavibacteria bacterium]
MSKLYLQNIVESIVWENLPAEWINLDLAKFSQNKTLFDYQQQSLKNAIKALYKYYNDLHADKYKFFELYQYNGFSENLDLDLKNNKNKKIFEEYDKDYTIRDDRIEFYHFINRMSFWMATGSGKTLVIVKLLEILGNLISSNQIPAKDILFLTYREDLIEQFKKHIEEFNYSNNSVFINLFDLKNYDSIKRDNRLRYGNELTVFYYRSDLISDEQKDKIIDFRNYDNSGNWYLLLDEAHKGEKEDSKRQQFYSILSRNGFLFNFSATFTDQIDFATCVFNFNLEKFITNGYGKQIFISKSDISNISSRNEFTEEEKKIIVLKILLLYAFISKQKEIIGDKFYHKPLIITLVNSVNTEDSDLYLFFKEIEKIASGQGDNEILNKAKEKLLTETDGTCEFTNEVISINEDIINSLTYYDILKNVFNAETYGRIEVLKIPGNKQEIVFKLTSSERPFGLIKIGDISEWLKNKLTGYEIIETFDNESIFTKLNKNDSDITILMGSRSFYEGWDSNRPNIILYINIGKGSDSRKFVLQSIGRGVRIEPITNRRKRIQFLYNNNEINKEDFNQIKNYVQALETLFVFGTKAKNLAEVIETLKEEKQEELLGDLFEINPDLIDKLLLIPVYKESEKIIAEERETIKFLINSSDYQKVKEYFNYLGYKIVLIKYQCNVSVLNALKRGFNGCADNYFKLDSQINPIKNPDLLLRTIISHFENKVKEFNTFKPLQNEIIHFKSIRISKDKLDDLREKIEKVKRVKDRDGLVAALRERFERGEISLDDYTKQIEEFALNLVRETEISYGANENLKIKYLANHYYIPVALTESDTAVYIQHIIKHPSEVYFINELENYLQKNDNKLKNFDWWYFSKIDETLDEVFIPYYNPKLNRIVKFKPDFIFWLKKDSSYFILFVDPKSTEYTDAFRKIDGYKKIFESHNNLRIFNYDGLQIKVYLKLFNTQILTPPEQYRSFWCNDINNLFDDIIN